jgi:Helix-turn-helix domain
MECDDLLRQPTCTVEEAGRLLRLSRSASYKAARRGELGDVIRIGGAIRVSTASLRRLLGIEA